jgi:PAS domain S-box-containing protein
MVDDPLASSLRDSAKNPSITAPDPLHAVRDYAIVTLNPDGTVVTWNAGAEAMTGYVAPDMIGRSFACLYTEADRQAGKPQALLQEAAATGRVADEGWRVRRDGSCIWVFAVTTALHDASGMLVGYAKISRDVTARQQAERALQQTLLQLEETNRQLEDRDHQRACSLSMMSHELLSPLTSTKGYLENLLDGVAGALPEKAVQYLRRIHTNNDRVIRLTSMLLDLARLDAGSLTMEPEAVHLREVVTDLMQDLERAAAKKAILLRADHVTDVPVRADRRQLEQILHNLIHNAIKYTPERGRVEVRSDPTDAGQVTISVEDTGCGIPPDHHDKVFWRFHRAPSPVREGSGLGLAITKQLVELHGGNIWLESEPGRGSRFFVSLPRASSGT